MWVLEKEPIQSELDVEHAKRGSKITLLKLQRQAGLGWSPCSRDPSKLIAEYDPAT